MPSDNFLYQMAFLMPNDDF